MPLIFLQHLIHHKMEAHVVIICLINDQVLVFRLKHYKMEVFQIVLLLLFHSRIHFYIACISFQQHAKCLFWMLLQIKITEMMTKNGHTKC